MQSVTERLIEDLISDQYTPDPADPRPDSSSALGSRPGWDLWRRALERMATSEKSETGPITLMITDRGHGRRVTLPARLARRHRRPRGGGAERCERWAAGQQRAARVREHEADDGITLAELKIEVGEVALGLAPQDPAEGARLRSETKVAVLRAALDANVAELGAELQALSSRMMLRDRNEDDTHLRYFRFTVGETVEMSWGKNADGSSQSSGALAWLGCGSAPPKRRTVTGVALYRGHWAVLAVRTGRGDVHIRAVDTTRWKTARGGSAGRSPRL